MKIIAVTQARINSSRLYNKIFMPINGVNILDIHVNRILKSTKISKLIIATTTNNLDDYTYNYIQHNNWNGFRGSENNVLERFYDAVNNENADYIIRLTSDCPLIDSTLIDEIIDFTIDRNLDYCSNTLMPQFPDGQDIEIFKLSCLQKAYQLATLNSDKEHVTPFIRNNSSFMGGEMFVSENFNNLQGDYSKVRMTLDEQNDFELLENIINNLGFDSSWKTYSDYILNHQEIFKLNNNTKRNEGLLKSIQNEENK